jgi:hypothetical protein
LQQTIDDLSLLRDSQQKELVRLRAKLVDLRSKALRLKQADTQVDLSDPELTLNELAERRIAELQTRVCNVSTRFIYFLLFV